MGEAVAVGGTVGGVAVVRRSDDSWLVLHMKKNYDRDLKNVFDLILEGERDR